jgi:hypothetical protein
MIKLNLQGNLNPFQLGRGPDRGAVGEGLRMTHARAASGKPHIYLLCFFVLFCTFLKKSMKQYKKLCPEDIAFFTFYCFFCEKYKKVQKSKCGVFLMA